MQLKMLVLPAPFGPMIAKRSPAATSTLTPARATTPPKLRCNPSRASSAMRAYALPRSGEGHANGPPVVSMTDESVERLSGNSILGMTPPRLDGRLLHKWRDATLTRRACQYIGRRDPPVRPPTTGSRQRPARDVRRQAARMTAPRSHVAAHDAPNLAPDRDRARSEHPLHLPSDGIR